MRPVGVHLDDDLGAADERDPEAVEIRPAEALFRGPVPDPDPGVDAGQIVGDAAGAVGRAVVDDEQRRAGQRLEDRGRDARDVLGLVVRREHHPGAGPERAGGWL